MACVNMYNPEHHQHQSAPSFMAPRMSFSSDFAVEPPVQNRAMSLRCHAEEDLNFEFSVGSHPMMAADQLFSKGRILPLKDNAGAATAARPPTTLRDELRGGGDDDERASTATTKASCRWKEMLGLRKALCVGGNGPAAKKASSSDKQGVATATDMVTDDDNMAASNQHQEL